MDLITLNDGEARQLTETANLVKAARDPRARTEARDHQEGGARRLHVHREDGVLRPAYPLEDVFDPTGAATRSRAGSWGTRPVPAISASRASKRAVVYGSAMGSFAVERFSIQRFGEFTREEIRARVKEFYRLVSFEEDLLVVTDPVDYKSAGRRHRGRGQREGAAAGTR